MSVADFPAPSISRRAALLGLASLAAPALMIGRAEAAVDRGAVFGDPNVPVLGNPAGDVAVAVWFDYRCPFCRKAEPELMQVVKEDGHVAVLLKDWPIFGKVSERAARLTWSTRHQNKLAAVHAALMAGTDRPTDARVDEVLSKSGIDRNRLEADASADTAAFDALVARNGAQAEAFGFPGTPAYVIGSFVFPGVLDAGGFRQAIADARRKR